MMSWHPGALDWPGPPAQIQVGLLGLLCGSGRGVNEFGGLSGTTTNLKSPRGMTTHSLLCASVPLSRHTMPGSLVDEARAFLTSCISSEYRPASNFRPGLAPCARLCSSIQGQLDAEAAAHARPHPRAQALQAGRRFELHRVHEPPPLRQARSWQGPVLQTRLSTGRKGAKPCSLNPKT